jgi:hypothetical protein
MMILDTRGGELSHPRPSSPTRGIGQMTFDCAGQPNQRRNGSIAASN